MAAASRDITTFPEGDIRRLFYLQNYEWALKMAFRYLGRYEVAVATVHESFLRLFQLPGQGIGPTDVHGMTPRWAKAIFIKAAVKIALQNAVQDTPPVRAGNVQFYLRELAVRDDEGADPSKYRNAIAAVLLLPLYPRLAYNLCIIEGYSRNEAAGLLGITESLVAGHVQKARALLQTMTLVDLKE